MKKGLLKKRFLEKYFFDKRFLGKASLLLCLLLLLSAFPAAARADSLPPPASSLDVAFTGLEGETYYVGLLGPMPEDDVRVNVLTLHVAIVSKVAKDNMAVLQKFESYEDTDGLVALNTVQDCSETQCYHLDVFPSYRFKVLIYFPSTDHFVVSDRVYSYNTARNSSVVDAASLGLSAESSGPMDFGMQIAHPIGTILADFFVRLTLTLAVEMGVAWLFHLRGGRVFRFILIVNAITQALLMAALMIVNYRSSLLAAMLFYVVLESAVFLLEGILYAIFLKRYSEAPIPAWKPWVYAWAANAASYIAGELLFLFI